MDNSVIVQCVRTCSCSQQVQPLVSWLGHWPGPGAGAAWGSIGALTHCLGHSSGHHGTRLHKPCFQSQSHLMLASYALLSPTIMYGVVGFSESFE